MWVAPLLLTMDMVTMDTMDMDMVMDSVMVMVTGMDMVMDMATDMDMVMVMDMDMVDTTESTNVKLSPSQKPLLSQKLQ